MSSAAIRSLALVALAALLLGAARVSPCNDFYRFADGDWLARNPIPPAYGFWSHDNEIIERTQKIVRAVLENAQIHTVDGDIDTRRLGLFYRSCMDTHAIETAGITPIRQELDAIDAIADRAGVVAAAARINGEGGNALFAFSSAQDLRDSRRVVGELDQGGLGLPDRDYYLRSDPKARRLIDGYQTMIAAQLENLGESPAKARAAAVRIVALETRLAAAQLPNVELRNPRALDHPTSVLSLRRLAPRIDWSDYFRLVDAPEMESLNVGMPRYVGAVSRELSGTSLADWKAYLRWRLIAADANALPARFEQAAFRFYGVVIGGQKVQLPRWKRCVTATDFALGDAVGREYVKAAFSPQAKARALALVDNLQATLRADLATTPWMTPTARRRAVAKLDLLVKKIGYPEHWRDYTAMRIEDQPYVLNATEARRFEVARQLAKIGRPLDRSDWQITAATDNAYYDPQLNEIVFPAAILQPPYFSASGEDAVNYGEIGATIGHEMTHGFDDEGRQFDGYGNLRNWWTAVDSKAWEERTRCIIQQADRYVAVDDLHQNGKLVVGEATADLGGLIVAYRAFERAQSRKPRRIIDGRTPEQRFFIAYASSWATNYTPAVARYLVQADVHPVASYRVNGTVANIPEFAAAFRCPAGALLAPAHRCAVW